MADAAAAKETHVGTCHCQAVRFTVRVPPLVDNGTCDCSHCSKRGVLWGFCPRADFTFERGHDALRAYEFGAKSFKHYSCATCGTLVPGPLGELAEGKDPSEVQVGYNVRALRDVDVHTLPLVSYSGINRDPPYVPAPPFAHGLEPADGQVVLHGACHCQAVQFAVRTRALGVVDAAGDKVEVLDCNCSICGGNGAVWMYPEDADYAFSPGTAGHLTQYTFTPDGPRQNRFYSCATCSCLVYEKRSESTHIGLNVRLIDSPLDMAKIGVEKNDWRSRGSPYVLRD